MNKYQEALDKICSECQKLMSQIPTKEHEDSIEIHSCGHTMCPYRTISNDYCEEYDTLQELIDNQADYVSYQDLKVEYEEEIKELIQRIETLNSLYNTVISQCEKAYNQINNDILFKERLIERWRESTKKYYQE